MIVFIVTLLHVDEKACLVELTAQSLVVVFTGLHKKFNTTKCFISAGLYGNMTVLTCSN